MAGKVLNISLNATITPLQKALESVGKMMNDFAASIEKTDKKMADSIRTNVADMNASLDKVKQSFVNTETAGDKAGKGGTASLRTQLKQATLEAQKLAVSVGTSDPKFIEAAKRAAELKDTIEDTNDAIQSYKGEGAFIAANKAAQALTGGIGAIQGAMNLLGADSENTQEAIKKMQSIMALTQGLAALEDVGRSFKQLKTVASEFGQALKAAIGGTGIGLLLIAVGALAANWDKVMSAVNGVSAQQEKLHEQLQKNIKSKQHELELFDAQKAQMLLAGKTEKEILQARMQRINMVIKEMSADLALQKQMRDGQIAAAQRNKDIVIGVIDILAKPLKLLLAGIDAIGDAFGAQFELVKKFESFEGSMANLLFDPKEVKDKADKSIKEAELALEKTKSDYAQAQLDIRAFDKKSAEDAKKIHEEKIKKIIEENQKLKQDLKSAELDKPFQGLNFGAQKVIDQLVQANIYMQKFKANTSSFVPPKLESPKLTFSDDQLERFKLMKDSANALNDAFKNAAAEGISTFAFALGTALVEGGKGFDNMFQTILSIVAKASVALGNAFIAMGLASQKVKDSLFSDPYMAIAAGAALVVAGGVAQAVIKNMGAKKMEQGGLVYGNSFVNVGEYGNAHTNPEVIAPLSKLKDMIGGSNTQRVMVEGRLYGSQLAMASSRSQSVIKRVTGRR